MALTYKVLCGDCKQEYQQERSKPTVCGFCGSDFIAVKLIDQEPHFSVQDEGSVTLMHPLNTAAEQWIEENLGEDVMFFGKAFVVEHRYVNDLLMKMVADGCNVN